MNIAMCTLFTPNYQELKDTAIVHNREYAKKNNIPFYVYNDKLDRRPASWSKILVLQKELPKHDWLLWIDADAVITNWDLSLENFPEFSDNEFVIEDDTFSINAGVFFIKNCPNAFHFLNLVYAQTHLIGHRWWEQQAMIEIFEKNLSPIKKKILPSQTKPFGLERHENRIPSINGRIDFWVANYDFILHTPGMSIGDRVSWLKKAIAMVKK